MDGPGRRAHRAALRSADMTGAERLASLAGICAFLAAFFAAGLFAPAAILSFWGWVAMIVCSIGFGAAIFHMLDKPAQKDDPE